MNELSIIILLSIHINTGVMSMHKVESEFDKEIGSLYQNGLIEGSGLEITHWCTAAHILTPKGLEMVTKVLSVVKN